MESTTIKVHNIKCHGCANSITKSLLKEEMVEEVFVTPEDGKIEIKHKAPINLEFIKQKLSSLGYTEDDPTLVDSAKSYVSCMIGRVSK